MIVLDMDAPKSCTNCPCATEDFGETRCVLGSPDIDWNERPCTCPMINADGLISREEVLRYISHKNCIESEEMLRGKEPCEDAISRQAMLDGLASIAKVKAKSDAQKALMGRVMFFTEQLPPVTPRQRMGKWTRKLIRNEKGGCIGAKMICSECVNDNKHDEYMDYCPNCGAKMEGEE